MSTIAIGEINRLVPILIASVALLACGHQQYRTIDAAMQAEEARNRRAEDAKRVELNAIQSGILQDLPDSSYKFPGEKDADDLVNQLNDLITENKTSRNFNTILAYPSFALDVERGRLTLRLNARSSRILMIRHISRVNVLYTETTYQIAGHSPTKVSAYHVVINSIDLKPVFLTKGPGANTAPWNSTVELYAKDAGHADRIAEKLQALVNLYGIANQN